MKHRIKPLGLFYIAASLFLIQLGCSSQKELAEINHRVPISGQSTFLKTNPYFDTLNTVVVSDTNIQDQGLGKELNYGAKRNMSSPIRKLIHRKIKKRVIKKIKKVTRIDPEKLLKQQSRTTTLESIALLVIMLGSIVLTIFALRLYYPSGIGCIGAILWPVLVYVVIAGILLGIYAMLGGSFS